jgi:hypothetical protein
MITIRPNKMPRLWWLFPWSYARTLHMSANALKAYADHQDEIVDNQRQTIRHLMAENYRLQRRVRDQDDAIIKGTAITPDAHPHE